ncbi:apolipoprotein N-acyltransferase [Pendulispora brunnea]|uniref:Apolipoprotein N-acyltransferase n=1 Tax=Pendulispora brunnea TaxID=2905690 RepID=A0ABZ2K9X0_9BACT
MKIAIGAALSAVLLALYAQVSGAWFVLGFVALVPWLLALNRVRSLWEALGGGLAMSVTMSVAVFSWLPATLERYAGTTSSVWPWLLLVMAAPLLQPQFLTFAVVRYLNRKARPSNGEEEPPRRQGFMNLKPLAFLASWRFPSSLRKMLADRVGPARCVLAAAAAYVATELLASKLLFDTLGLGLYPSRYLRQGADLVGVHGLTWMLLLVNEAVAAVMARKAEARPYVVAALGLIGLDLGYGWLRCAQLRDGGPATVVGVVQANITNYDKLRADRGAFEAVRYILDEHYALSDDLRRNANPDLIVWPETVYPTTFGSPKSEAGQAFDTEILAFAAGRGTPVVFGAYDASAGHEYNAAFFVEAASQKPVRAYRKSLLFPFTERVPPLLDSEWLRARLPWVGHWDTGPGPDVVSMALRDGRRLSALPLICYDALSTTFVAQAAQRGADLIVTLSNDSWFPDERAPRLHLVSAAFRSIETRLPQVRSTNSGISAVISPAGDWLATAGWNERRIVTASLPTGAHAWAPAVLLSPWLAPLLASWALLELLATQLSKRNATNAGIRTK